MQQDLANELDFRSKFKDRSKRLDYLDTGWDTDDMTKVSDWSDTSSSHDRLDDFVWKVMQTQGDKVVSDYKKQGYDAIIDPYDFVMNISDMPIVMLDPTSSMKQDSYHRRKS